jgi:hypothetical protein
LILLKSGLPVTPKRLRAEADALLSGKQVPQSLPEPTAK